MKSTCSFCDKEFLWEPGYSICNVVQCCHCGILMAIGRSGNHHTPHKSKPVKSPVPTKGEVSYHEMLSSRDAAVGATLNEDFPSDFDLIELRRLDSGNASA